jgi:hypothetical protein
MLIDHNTQIPAEHKRWSGMSGKELLNLQSEAIPLQAWTGPEGSRKLRLPYFKTIDT